MKNNNLAEWRIPVINRIIRAEFLNSFLVFTLIDRNSDRAQEVGFWDASNCSWSFVAVYKNDADKMREQTRRMMMIIIKRYPARISRLQNELKQTLAA